MAGHCFPLIPTILTLILLLLFYHANFQVPYPKPINQSHQHTSPKQMNVLDSVTSDPDINHINHSIGNNAQYTKTLVIPKTASDNTTWLELLPKDINVVVYSVDEGDAMFHSPTNKGHEGTYAQDISSFSPSSSSLSHPSPTHPFQLS